MYYCTIQWTIAFSSQKPPFTERIIKDKKLVESKKFDFVLLKFIHIPSNDLWIKNTFSVSSLNYIMLKMFDPMKNISKS